VRGELCYFFVLEIYPETQYYNKSTLVQTKPACFLHI